MFYWTENHQEHITSTIRTSTIIKATRVNIYNLSALFLTASFSPAICFSELWLLLFIIGKLGAREEPEIFFLAERCSLSQLLRSTMTFFLNVFLSLKWSTNSETKWCRAPRAEADDLICPVLLRLSRYTSAVCVGSGGCVCVCIQSGAIVALVCMNRGQRLSRPRTPHLLF